MRAVPLRLEFTVDAAGPAERVWRAIATAEGLAEWMVPAEVEERLGGTVVFHLPGETTSVATITAWEPPHRLAFEEPDWPALAGYEGAAVSALVTEMVVAPRDGGRCDLRVVTHALGTGAAWEREFFADMRANWVPMFDALEG